MKTWLKGGLLIGFIGAIIGTTRIYFKFQKAFAPLDSSFGAIGEFATFSPSLGGVHIGLYAIGFIEWFVISFIIGSIIGLIIQKIKA